MNKRWIIVLLFISLAFNLAVIGSMLYLHITIGNPPPPPPGGEGRFHGPMDKPGAGPLIGDNEKLKSLRDQFIKTKRDLMTELAKETIDEARLNAIVDSSLVAQGKLERELGSALIAKRKSMTAEEAKEFFSKRIDGHHRMGDDRFRYYRNNRQRRY